MKSFQIIIDFKNVPDDFSMEDAKGMSSQLLQNSPNVNEMPENKHNYFYRIKDVKKITKQ